MTVYYDATQSALSSMFVCRGSIVTLVFRRPEFWVYIAMHTICVLLFKMEFFTLTNFRWEAAGAAQFFLMFMLIFYNGSCYDRYLTFYSSCMDALRSSVLFVQELTVSMPFEAVEKHRVVACRYILTTIYLFYMSVTGGIERGCEWVEVERKGLLTTNEAIMLREYPCSVTPVLTSWAMQVVCEALKFDEFWKYDKAGEPRSMHIAHIHNRLDAFASQILVSCNRISYMLMLPIPFPYFHLMNFLLVSNFALMAVVLASFKNWATILPFSFALLIYMGLREVSVALADPFGTDEIDFPVEKFLDYTFDHSVGLLEAFSTPRAYEQVANAVEAVAPFTDEEMLRSTFPAVVHSPRFKFCKANPFDWEKPMPFENMNKAAVKRTLTSSLLDPSPEEKSSRSESKSKSATVASLPQSESQLVLPLSPDAGQGAQFEEPEARMDKEALAHREAFLMDRKLVFYTIRSKLSEKIAYRAQLRKAAGLPSLDGDIATTNGGDHPSPMKYGPQPTTVLPPLSQFDHSGRGHAVPMDLTGRPGPLPRQSSHMHDEVACVRRQAEKNSGSGQMLQSRHSFRGEESNTLPSSPLQTLHDPSMELPRESFDQARMRIRAVLDTVSGRDSRGLTGFAGLPGRTGKNSGRQRAVVATRGAPSPRSSNSSPRTLSSGRSPRLSTARRALHRANEE